MAGGPVLPLGYRQSPPQMGLFRTEVKSLSRLCPVQISCQSLFTFSSPRSRNRRKPRLCLISPKTGSTVAILRA